jgi:hypothetical protein
MPCHGRGLRAGSMSPFRSANRPHYRPIACIIHLESLQSPNSLRRRPTHGGGDVPPLHLDDQPLDPPIPADLRAASPGATLFGGGSRHRWRFPPFTPSRGGWCPPPPLALPANPGHCACSSPSCPLAPTAETAPRRPSARGTSGAILSWPSRRLAISTCCRGTPPWMPVCDSTSCGVPSAGPGLHRCRLWGCLRAAAGVDPRRHTTHVPDVLSTTGLFARQNLAAPGGADRRGWAMPVHYAPGDNRSSSSRVLAGASRRRLAFGRRSCRSSA